MTQIKEKPEYINAIDLVGDYSGQRFKLKNGYVIWESISWRGHSCYISRIVEKGGNPFLLGLNYIGRYIDPDTLLLIMPKLTP